MNMAHTGYMHTVMPTVDSVSCVLSTSSMDASLRTGRRSVATNEVAAHYGLAHHGGPSRHTTRLEAVSELNGIP